MKKTSLVLLCAVLFAFAPAALAEDEAAFSLDGFFGTLMSIFLGLSEDPEMGVQCPPGGQTGCGAGAAANMPPNNSAAHGDEPEMGWQIEPFG